MTIGCGKETRYANGTVCRKCGEIESYCCGDKRAKRTDPRTGCTECDRLWHVSCLDQIFSIRNKITKCPACGMEEVPNENEISGLVSNVNEVYNLDDEDLKRASPLVPRSFRKTKSCPKSRKRAAPYHNHFAACKQTIATKMYRPQPSTLILPTKDEPSVEEEERRRIHKKIAGKNSIKSKRHFCR